MIECVIPILRVNDLAISIDYYENALGFKQEWNTGSLASVKRDGFSIYLSEGDQGQSGTWVWIGVEDIDAIHAEYQAKGAIIRQPPINYSWACEMHVEDPDGHVLRVAGGPKEDQPYND